MEYKSVKGFNSISQLGFLFVFFGLGFLLAGGVQFLIAMKMMPGGISLENLESSMLKAMQDPKNVNLSRLAQVSGTFCLFFVPAVLFSLIVHGRNPFWLGFNKYVNIYQVLLGFLIMFTANIMAAPLEDLSKAALAHMPSLDASAKKLEEAYNQQVKILSNLTSWPEFLMALAIMAFFPALFEEIFFRGVLQNLFVKWWKMPLLAIIVTSLLFSLIHGSIYLFVSRAVLGFVLGLMYFKTKNIWVNVVAHFLNNSIAVAQLFAMSRSTPKADGLPQEPRLDWWFAIIAIFILFFLFRFLDRYSAKNRLKIDTREQLLLAESNSYPFAKQETA